MCNPGKGDDEIYLIHIGQVGRSVPVTNLDILVLSKVARSASCQSLLDFISKDVTGRAYEFAEDRGVVSDTCANLQNARSGLNIRARNKTSPQRRVAYIYSLFLIQNDKDTMIKPLWVSIWRQARRKGDVGQDRTKFPRPIACKVLAHDRFECSQGAVCRRVVIQRRKNTQLVDEVVSVHKVPPLKKAKTDQPTQPR